MDTLLNMEIANEMELQDDWQVGFIHPAIG